MKMPNDKKRPNTNSGKETRERKGNQKYLWVSKRVLEVPVFAADGSLTNIKQMVAEKRGKTYTNPHKALSREDQRRDDFKNMQERSPNWTRKNTDSFLRFARAKPGRVARKGALLENK